MAHETTIGRAPHPQAGRVERKCRPPHWAIAAVLASTWPVAGFANNGLNLIGFGTESIGMGGADIAVARDTTALNTNPAAIARLRRARFDGFVEAASVGQRHADVFGNDRAVSNRLIGVGGFGLPAPLGDTDLVAGIGLFGQGGAGFVYRDLATPFGGTDSVALVFGVGRLTPALAWRATPALSVGLSLPITLARAKQEFFPGVSQFNAADPARSFFGTRIEDMRSTRPGVRLGALYEATPELTLAAVFGSRTRLPLDRGRMVVNMSAIGLGTVTYRDVRIEGLGLAQEIGAGVAWRATAATLVSFEVTRLRWSKVLKTETLTARNPDNAAAPPSLQQSLALDWSDQTVFALGVAYDVDARLTLYGGANYGRNPVPARTTSPFLAPIGEKHLTLGARRRVQPDWELSAALEVLAPKTVTYTNPELPFGADARELSRYVALHLMLGRRW